VVGAHFVLVGGRGRIAIVEKIRLRHPEAEGCEISQIGASPDKGSRLTVPPATTTAFWLPPHGVHAEWECWPIRCKAIPPRHPKPLSANAFEVLRLGF
jgi:hypothetical protein